jgi:hypothetical protein
MAARPEEKMKWAPRWQICHPETILNLSRRAASRGLLPAGRRKGFQRCAPYTFAPGGRREIRIDDIAGLPARSRFENQHFRFFVHERAMLDLTGRHARPAHTELHDSVAKLDLHPAAPDKKHFIFGSWRRHGNTPANLTGFSS